MSSGSKNSVLPWLDLSGEGSRISAKLIKENPLPGKPSMDNVMDFAYVHFQLCMKYTNAVLNGEAYVPNQK
jgi:hypothetical protein